MGADRAAFRAINPNTLVPVLVEADRTLWETDAIACRLAALCDPDFWPADRQAEVTMWASWSAHHFIPAGGAFYFENIIRPEGLDRPADAAVLAEADGSFRRYAGILDDILAGRTWLVGDRPTYADFRVATALPFAERALLPVAGFRHILAWHDRLNRLDAWRAPFDGLD
jgi:glutathione S-transferase